jgi:NADH-quinone oxidoreductase subunit J
MKFLIFVLCVLGIISSLFVISVKNSVLSVFYLIVTFCISACLLLTLTVDFLSIIFVVVYVGAIAVLFLFVVMMLNIKYVEFAESFLRYIPFSIILSFVFINELLYINTQNEISNVTKSDWVYFMLNTDSILLLSKVLYTNYIHIFFIAAIILLLAMIGTINITLYHALM